MRFNPECHHRRSIRLKGYDYSQPGAHFITICTQDRACLVGEVVDGEMRLNDAGRMVQMSGTICQHFTQTFKPTHLSSCPITSTASSSS